MSLFIKDNIEFKQREDLSITNKSYKSKWIEVENKNNCNKIIGVIYRTPGTDIKEFNEYLTNTLQIINNEYMKTIYMGDLNINLFILTLIH